MTSTTAVRLARAAVVALLAVLLLPSSAGAAGTGGIEISPYPGVVDGKQVTAFHVEVPRGGSTDVKYSLRNTTGEQRSATLYAASAARDGKGGWSIGDPGSSDLVSFAKRTVTLPGGETEIGTFEARGDLDEEEYAALVVEVTNGTITQRAATLVYLRPGPRVPLPVLLVIGAFVMLAVAGTATWLVRRTTRTRGSSSPEGVAA